MMTLYQIAQLALLWGDNPWRWENELCRAVRAYQEQEEAHTEKAEIEQ